MPDLHGGPTRAQAAPVLAACRDVLFGYYDNDGTPLGLKRVIPPLPTGPSAPFRGYDIDPKTGAVRATITCSVDDRGALTVIVTTAPVK